MNRDEHERKVCELAVCFFNERHDTAIEITGKPDKDEREKPAVDFICESVEPIHVIEHTLIESFGEQIADSVRLFSYLVPLERELNGKLPTPGHYHLWIPSGESVKIEDADEVRKNITRWIKDNAGDLSIATPGGEHTHYINGTPNGVPFEVKLVREDGMKDKEGCLFLGRIAPEKLEEERSSRIKRALDQKCPKLEAAVESGGISILVLESNDIGLGSYVSIAEAVVENLAHIEKQPDHIILMETDSEPWIAYSIKEENLIYPNIFNVWKEMSLHDV